MNIELFIDKCAAVFPGKELTPGQWPEYRSKLRQFSSSELESILNHIIENCRFFPKIADIMTAARTCVFSERNLEFKPHTWQPADCAYCRGSGMVAAWYTEGREKREYGPVQTLRLICLEPYTESPKHQGVAGYDVRAFFRCHCLAGEKPSGMTGLARWNREKPLDCRERGF